MGTIEGSSGGDRNIVRYTGEDRSEAGTDKRVRLVESRLPGGRKASGDKDVELMAELDSNAFPPGTYIELYDFCKRAVANQPWFLPLVRAEIVGFSEQEKHHQEGMLRTQENILNQDRSELSDMLNAPAPPDVSKEAQLGRWNERRKRSMKEQMEREERIYRSVIRDGAQYPFYNTREEDLAEDKVSTEEELRQARAHIQGRGGQAQGK